MIKKSTIETEEYFEIKRAMETYFRSQNEVQETIAGELRTIAMQQKALLSIFAHSAEHLERKK